MGSTYCDLIKNTFITIDIHKVSIHIYIHQPRNILCYTSIMRILPYTLEEKFDREEEELKPLLTVKPSYVENEIRIEVYKGARTFGLVLVGGVNNQQFPGDCGIYVEKVLEGGLADVDNRIIEGDRITAIKQHLDDGDAYTFSFDDNGSKTHEDAKQILRRCKGRVEIFIVRKHETSSTQNETLNSTSQNISILPPCGGKSVNTIPKNNKKCDQSDETKDTNSVSSITDSTSVRKYKEDVSPSKNITISSTVLQNVRPHIDCSSKIKLINVTPLKHSRHLPLSRNTASCSFDYRDMAKYGIRPNSSLCTDIIQPLNTKVKDHRIKKNWISNKMSSLSIQEDEEEELHAPSIPQVQNRFEPEMEQRVL